LLRRKTHLICGWRMQGVRKLKLNACVNSAELH
jgi:hypothetical protein